jgi:hypothetical protein
MLNVNGLCELLMLDCFGLVNETYHWIFGELSHRLECSLDIRIGGLGCAFIGRISKYQHFFMIFFRLYFGLHQNWLQLMWYLV